MTTVMLIATTGVLAVAGFVQGLTGFGFGMVAMGLIPSILGFDQAQAVVTLMGLATCLTMTGLAARHVSWSGAEGLWIGSALGVPLGFEAVGALPQSLTLRLLGLTICGMVLFEVFVGRPRSIHPPDWLAWPIGVGGGILSGAFNIGGPPLVVFIYGRPWPKERQVATLSGLFLLHGLVRLALLLAAGRVRGSTWTASAWAVGPLLAAIVLGQRALRLVTQGQLRAGVDLVLLALGGRYLFAGS